MLKQILLLTALVSAISLTACSKDEDAVAAADEHNRLVLELNSKIPNSSMSDEELNDYEAKLNRMEALEQVPGTFVRGDNSNFFRQRRQLIADARSEKRRQALSVDPSSSRLNSSSQTASAEKLRPSLDSLRTKLSRLSDETTQLSQQLTASAPDASWSNEQLKNDMNTIDRLTADIGEFIELVNQYPELSSIQKLIPTLNDESALLKKRRDIDQKILDNRSM